MWTTSIAIPLNSKITLPLHFNHRCSMFPWKGIKIQEKPQTYYILIVGAIPCCFIATNHASLFQFRIYCDTHQRSYNRLDIKNWSHSGYLPYFFVILSWSDLIKFQNTTSNPEIKHKLRLKKYVKWSKTNVSH